MPHKDPARRKAYYEENKEKNKEKRRKYFAKYYESNTEKRKESDANRLQDRKQSACESIKTGEIIDRYKWDMWCKEIKRCAKNKKQTYSDDFTNDVMFGKMIIGCFYCGDIATTIDRIDSKLEHTEENCVASCHGCNMSKGVADPSTFIRKAYYRAREKYYDDDTNIWFVHKNKPNLSVYKTRAKKKGVSFDLTKEDWERLIDGDCMYCKRRPATWFGVDRVIPSRGYVFDNVVSCCFDCNLDKLDGDVESMIARNKRITDRIDAGELIITESGKKHRKH